MAEPEMVDAAWRTATYGLIGVNATLAGVIAKMAHWWVKVERPRVATDYKEINDKLFSAVEKMVKAINRSSDYLRDWYNELHPEKATRTQFDFNKEKGE